MYFAPRLNLQATARNPPLLTTLLICLCILVFFYQLVPSFTEATDEIVGLVTDHFNLRPAGSDSCTKEVGSAQCCGLFLAAAPCLEQCRKLHIDRETLSLTLEYDECASQCLVEYHTTCPGGAGE